MNGFLDSGSSGNFLTESLARRLKVRRDDTSVSIETVGNQRVAAGVMLETPAGDPIEDGCWLRRDETTHINMAELDAAVRGMNLAITWGMRRLNLRTDSSTVHRWIGG